MQTDEWYTGKQVVVLGGAGFIGSNLARALVARDARVTVVDAFLPHTGGDDANLVDIRSRIEVVPQAVADWSAAPDGLAAADLIIDAMGLTAHHVGLDRPLLDLEANLVSHLHLIERLGLDGGPPVIFLGSRGQYGRPSEARITEATPQVPLDPQGVNKAAAERLFRIYSRRHGWPVISLRLTNCFGEPQPVRGADLGLVGSFIRDLLADRTVEIFGSTERVKHLLYVQDLVTIILRLGAEPAADFQAYNVAGQPVALGALLETLVDLVGRGGYTVRPFPEEVARIDVGEVEFSDAALAARLGPLPRTDLRRALAATVDHFTRRLS